MRILVLSDSHGMPSRILDAVEAHPEAEALIFLGDGERDLDTVESYYHSLPNVIKVAGNCDFSSSLPLLRVVTLGGKKIYCTHGHAEHVKYGTDELLLRARQEGDIVLYGHTHTGVTCYDDGLYIMNPGSIRDGHYGMIDIVPGGIMLNEAKL